MSTPPPKKNYGTWIAGAVLVLAAVIGLIIWANSDPDPGPTDTSGSTIIYTPPGSTNVPGGSTGSPGTGRAGKTASVGEQRWMNDGCLYFWGGTQWIKDLWCRSAVSGNATVMDYYYSFDPQRIRQVRVDTGQAGVFKYKDFRTGLTQAYYTSDPSVIYTLYGGRYLTAAQYVQALDNAKIAQLQQQLANAQQQLQQKQATAQAQPPMVSGADAMAALQASQLRMTGMFARPACDSSYNGCI